ncbi:MAG: S41 family peptidase [Prevotella sp.]
MKKKLLPALLMLASVAASAQDNPLWMRYPAISPDGSKIAFAYKGDIFTVDANGGQARQLTTNPAYDYKPVWSPDGSRIAFASNREGSFDIYVVDAKGGTPRRLTTSSGKELPVAWKDNDHVLFQAGLMPSAESIVFNGSFSQVYEVDVDGRRPKMFSTLQMEDISINANGDLLYHDNKGYEDPWRKHHTSPITRDIWLKRGDSFKRLTSFAGEDRNPVWAADGTTFYYLSEQDGTFNVYSRTVDNAQAKQLTRFKGNPVRFLTASRGGKLCFGYDGEIYTLDSKQSEPRKVAISVVADRNDRDLARQISRSGATEVSLSPNGKEIAFVMHGDVYVTSVEYKTTKQITDTPEQERNIEFAPDGRSIVYASERGGVWQIYLSKLKNKDEGLFTYATEIEEERLTNNNLTSQLPKFAPDGKKIAYYENRGALKVMDLDSKKARTVLDANYVYSYSDGDIDFSWSPDSRWLLASYIGTGGWNSADVALVSAEDGKFCNLTNSGYNEGNAKWVLGGKAMLFSSDRAGFRSHGSWGAEDDAYLMFFDLDAYERFLMSKEEVERDDKAREEEKKKKEEEEKEKEKAEKDQKKGKDKDKAKVEIKKVEPLQLDTVNCRDRIVRLTNNSARLGDMLLSADGNTLYYQARYEDGYDLWKVDLKKWSTSKVMKGCGGRMVPDKDVRNVYVCRGGITKVDLGSGSGKPVEFEAWFNYKPYEERQYLFDHAWRQVKDKFYDPNLHGVDWEGYRKTYERFLPYINNNFDFSEMMSEMLGELNASHTGARYRAGNSAMQTATLGLFLDESYEGDGLKVKEVIKRGPFDVKNTGVVAGSIITTIDGKPIKAGEDYNALLDGKAGKPVRIGFAKAKGKKEETVVVKPISFGELNELLYKRWVDRNRQFVDSISGGRIAYVHVRAMDSDSFRKVYEELLSDRNRNRDAVVVDERHNGGGWLHDDLCTLLSGKEYQQFVPRGQYVGRDPYNKWTKPSCVLICEDDYSNGHGFPWVYKELGIGKLIGAPVAGTMTAVWWETLMDYSLVFGIPQVGCRSMKGVYGENTTLNPDIVVYNTPEDYINGYDRQLEKAVKELMK